MINAVNLSQVKSYQPQIKSNKTLQGDYKKSNVNFKGYNLNLTPEKATAFGLGLAVAKVVFSSETMTLGDAIGFGLIATGVTTVVFAVINLFKRT